jgi:hypothetical protein
MPTDDRPNDRKNRALPTWWPECDVEEDPGERDARMWRKARTPEGAGRNRPRPPDDQPPDDQR